MWAHHVVPIAFGLALATASPALAQGKAKHYAVSTDHAVVVTKEVLIRQGFEVVRVEKDGPVITMVYRRGNMGQGKGKGPPQRLVIKRVNERILFEQTPPAILVDIDVRLKLP
jgi:hypothetical protein